MPDEQRGPHRLTREEITSRFAEMVAPLNRIEQSTIEVTVDPAGRRAWLVGTTGAFRTFRS